MTPIARENVTQLVTAVLAVHGGLNERSRRALLAIGRQQGYGADEILRILEQVAHHDHDATILAITHAADSPDPREDVADKARKEHFAKVNKVARLTLSATTVALFLASAVLLVLSALAVRGIRPLDSGPQATVVTPSREIAPPIERTPDRAEQPAARQEAMPPAPQSSPEPAPFDASTYDALLQPFDEAPDRFRQIGAEAFTPVSQSLEHLAQTWTSLDRTTIEAAANRIANLLLVLDKDRSSDHAERLLELVLIPSSHLVNEEQTASRTLSPGRILPSTWSIGVATRLTKETYTNPRVRARLETHLSRAFPPDLRPQQPSFGSGATATLQLLARQAIDTASQPFAAPDPGSWGELRRVTVALYTIREQPTRFAVLDLITYAMRNGPDPSVSTATAQSLAVLVELVDWSDRASGQALLGWFDDQLVPTTHLASLVRLIEASPSSPDTSSVQPLTPAAPPIQRAAIRDELAGVYTLPQSPTDGWLEFRWTPNALRAVSESLDASSAEPTSSLASAAALSRVSAAASLRWNGSFDGAEREISNAFNAVTEARSRNLSAGVEETDLAALTSPAAVTDGRFALAYLNAKRNAETRLEAISALLASSGAIGPADADVLAEAALYAVPIEVRSAAQRAAQAHASSVAMTHALYETLPDAPRIDVTNTFFERYLSVRLPPPSDRRWLLSVRRELLAKLHTQVARQRRPLVDALADDLARTTSLATSASAAADPADAALQLYRETLATARQYHGALLPAHAPDRVELRHSRRVAIARGPIQTFLANRLSALELFAYTVVAERPSNEQRVEEILRELDASRAAAAHIFTQIEAVERASVRLWAIRLAVEFDESGGGNAS